MAKFYFTKNSKKEFEKLSLELRTRIKRKLEYLGAHEDVFKVLKSIEELPPATHRLRVGDYRLLLEITKKTKAYEEFDILKVGHRREIYG